MQETGIHPLEWRTLNSVPHRDALIHGESSPGPGTGTQPSAAAGGGAATCCRGKEDRMEAMGAFLSSGLPEHTFHTNSIYTMFC